MLVPQKVACDQPCEINGALLVPPGSPLPRTPHQTLPLRASQVDFVSPFEELFASLLDFYQVPWEYEPHFFAFTLSDEGNPTSGFRPDFYLPEVGCYYELTAGSPRIINLKNRRLRLLAEHHPAAQVRLWRARDYLGLAARLGVSLPEGLVKPASAPSPVIRLSGAGRSSEPPR